MYIMQKVCQACSFQAGEEGKSLGWCSSDCRRVKKSKKRNLDESESEVLLVEKKKKKKDVVGIF